MKKCVFMLLAMFLLSSCESPETVELKELNSATDAKLIASIESSGDRGLPFPEGSVVIKQSSTTYKIILPDGFKYLAMDDNGNFESIEPGTVTCMCTQGVGCSPVLYSGRYYCVMGGSCAVCTRKVTNNNKSYTVLGLYEENKSPIKFLVNNYSDNEIKKTLETKAITYNSLDSRIFQNQQVKKDLLDFYKIIFDNKIPDFILKNTEPSSSDNVNYAMIDIYGNTAVIPVPKNLDVNYALPGNWGCKCNSGSSGCTKDGMLGAKFCDAGNCTSCTLTSGGPNNN